MSAGYTPGPWSFSNGNLIRVNGPDLAHGWQRPVVVCGVHRIGKCRNGPDAERLAIANAKLIAAAPELLGEYQRAIDHLQGWLELHPMDATAETHAILHCARPLIAKATGDA